MDVQQDSRRVQAPSSTDIELAWAAGFFDGEGSFHGASLGASIGQVNRDNLFRFQAAMGFGNVSRPYDKGGKRPISFYRAYGDKAFATARKLWPFLGREKQDQFLRNAIRYCFRSVSHRRGGGKNKIAFDLGLHGIRQYKPKPVET